MTLNRRGFLAGLAVALAAPAIIRPGLLMPVRTPKLIVPAVGWEPAYNTLAEAMAAGAQVFRVNTIAPAASWLDKSMRLNQSELDAVWDEVAKEFPKNLLWPRIMVGEFSMGTLDTSGLTS